MKPLEEIKKNVLSQIKHVASVRCDNEVEICSLRRRENIKLRTRGGSCPGAKSAYTQVESSSSVRELKDGLGNLMCVQTMFGHLLKED